MTRVRATNQIIQVPINTAAYQTSLFDTTSKVTPPPAQCFSWEAARFEHKTNCFADLMIPKSARLKETTLAVMAAGAALFTEASRKMTRRPNFSFAPTEDVFKQKTMRVAETTLHSVTMAAGLKYEIRTIDCGDKAKWLVARLSTTHQAEQKRYSLLRDKRFDPFEWSEVSPNETALLTLACHTHTPLHSWEGSYDVLVRPEFEGQGLAAGLLLHANLLFRDLSARFQEGLQNKPIKLKIKDIARAHDEAKRSRKGFSANLAEWLGFEDAGYRLWWEKELVMPPSQ